MLANQASSTPPTTAASSDQRMPDGAGRLWTSLGQSPGLQMAWRRLPVFRRDMERRSAVVSLCRLKVNNFQLRWEEFNRFSHPQSPIIHLSVIVPITSATMARDVQFPLC